MIPRDDFSEYYADLLDGSYDCVDRIVLNAYFPLAQSGGGFRTWWRRFRSDDDLNNTALMRFAGRCARRVRAYAKKQNIPLIYCGRGERKHEIAEAHLPEDPNFRGIFCIIVGRAPGVLRDIIRRGKRGMDIQRKTPLPYVNHYSFHLMDPEWGHLTIKLCPHPPFNAQIILNGHEHVAIEARNKGIVFTKEGNCFTDVSDAAGLAGVADTMTASGCGGRLVTACQRWIYSSCLCFALTLGEQESSGFGYAFSVYQAEYSRNLIFTRGRRMEEVFQGVIDRTRSRLDLKTVKTIFGYARRFVQRSRKRKAMPPSRVVVERPVYDLTIFKVHFRRLTVKIYSKGDRVLRIEAIAHNTEDLRCGKQIDRFGRIVAALQEMVERFLLALYCADASFIDAGGLDELSLPSTMGARRVSGIDINKSRIRAVMAALIALAPRSRGFVISDLSAKVCEIIGCDATVYRARQAAYDLTKFRAKGLIRKVQGTRRYVAPADGLRKITAVLVLRDKVLKPLLAGVSKHRTGPKPKNRAALDEHYETIQIQMQRLFHLIGIAA